ncbi:unnamed protein product, partial [Amoebophrya sp. A25]|eukprot:GSA25T00023059001.1
MPTEGVQTDVGLNDPLGRVERKAATIFLPRRFIREHGVDHMSGQAEQLQRDPRILQYQNERLGVDLFFQQGLVFRLQLLSKADFFRYGEFASGRVIRRGVDRTDIHSFPPGSSAGETGEAATSRTSFPEGD